MSTLRPLRVLLVLICLLPACSKKGQGEPCSSDSECESGLVCDKHGGTSGKCYPPHGHGTPTDAATPAVDASGGSGGRGGSGGTGGGGTGGAGVDAGTGSPDTAAPDTATATPDTGAPDRTPDAGGTSETCTTYCQCLTQTCASQSGYPHANQAACLTACEKLTAMQVTCWQRFCTTAAMKSMSARAHDCEHAWGAVALAECQ